MKPLALALTGVSLVSTLTAPAASTDAAHGVATRRCPDPTTGPDYDTTSATYQLQIDVSGWDHSPIELVAELICLQQALACGSQTGGPSRRSQMAALVPGVAFAP